MKKTLGLIIIFILIAAVANATPAVREKCYVDIGDLMTAAKASLSTDGVEKARQFLSNKDDGDKAIYYSAVSIIEPLLRHDLMGDDVKRAKKFLKLISDRGLVTCIVSGGSGKFKGRGKYRVRYSLEVSAPTESNKKANVTPSVSRNYESASGKVYYLVVDQRRPGEKSSSGGSRIKIRLPR